MSVLPVELAGTFVVGVVRVPEPSAALTVTLGDAPRLARAPLTDDERCCACQVCAPVVAVAVAPGPLPAVDPYTTVKVEPAVSVTPETVIVWPATPTVPVDAVVYPAAVPVVDGALQPVGTTSVTEPLRMPPVAAV